MGIRILHLSDIHMPASFDPNFYSLMSKLNNAIIEYVNAYGEIDMAVVTGDVIDKGAVSSYKSNAPKFFSEIGKGVILPERFIFAAGNHDASRDQTVNRLVKDIKSTPFSTIESLHDFDRIYGARYVPFVEFVNGFTRSDIEKSYYVKTKVIRGFTIRFVVLNSSVCTFGSDFGKTGVSHYQLDSLVEQARGEPKADLVVALMHHPIAWMTLEEQALIYDYFEDSAKLGVNLVMHGHTHEGKVYGNYDVDGVFLNLVSGIGYEDQRKRKKKSNLDHPYRIAFYDIDPSKKSIVGHLKHTNAKKEIVPDTSLYRRIDNDGRFELVYGVNLQDRLKTKIHLPEKADVDVDQAFLKDMDLYLERVQQSNRAIRSSFDGIVKSYQKEKRTRENRESCMMKAFRSYLTIILFYYETIFKEIPEEDIRLHFRIYNPKTSTHDAFALPEDFSELTPIKWGTRENLIHHAYRLNRSLVASLNPTLCFNTNGEWLDYLTCPISDKKSPRATDRPMFSFGISVKGEKVKEAQRILVIMSYLRIEEHLQQLLYEFEIRIGDYSKVPFELK